MDKEIISFRDFLKTNDDEYNESGYLPNFESLEEDDSEFELTNDRIDYLLNEFELSQEEVNKLKQIDESEDSDYYNLYRDINESFSCDIFIEGSNPENASARLVIESTDWNLVFNGEIENGKCIIPIKKLDILSEDLVGKIKLEIIAEGNVFIPWENKFLVKSSKRVSTLNEKFEKKIGVKVDGIR